MTNNELIQNILSIPTESRTMEFKRLGSRNDGVDKTLQSIVAMANTDGGTIILGVDDPQKTTLKGLNRIFGIEENIELYDEIGRSVRKIYPPISGIWPPKLIDGGNGKRIGLLSVPKVGDGFRHYENHVWIRLERGNKMLNPQDILHLAYVKGFSRSDKELVEVDFNLLKTNFYEDWRQKRGISDKPIEFILEKTGLARKDDSKNLLPTRAAVLLFAEFPNDLLETKCSVRVFQVQGNRETITRETLNWIGTPKNINGPIAKQITDAHEYVLGLLKAGMRVPSGFRTTYSIPERAVKEAITNAVIHRDYHTKRDIEIRIFEDRIEVESPGLLPFNITPSNIGIERSHQYRNDLLVKHLREFPDPPNLDQNEGVRAMRQTMKTANLYPPIFFTYPNLQDAVRVVLLNEKAPNEWDKVSDYLIKNKYITNTEARGILLTEDTVKVSKRFNRWVKQGLLTKITPRTGAKRNVRYRLPTADERSLFTSDKSK
ncbi:MAG: AAA-4 family protein [Candidatus Nomurabacteria bacterium GW2011_GWC2_39_41]|uniref:AAA-4 family protein n=2 Tax=Candidatus Nomuraibacteriota TaxID=1752729 RepID=A0A837HR43_9BACT|nr:MAG: AAA-4 family protein [Candidatus Nomurabacteria bacterium GW2011_GWD2_39_12]KKR20390.1 MAG: AAA-4 family protein [Candidatus Nomurabacteria bacterium GW2011_GWC2_39_41]KKR37107.1 MAG: AAA-4 family protein [Candidatus Nomurabacteria bacterium GW2011_GWE2_40_10]KKR38282.1 MAG: AAA-4 family protein [Candidatus Nomurabacteria bacterium GW2011_GWB1_40_11]KKR39832.1 MAG: AAA-4 family protein [Parcubacteria group bacterium GW2011_GWC1_40_11]KKR67040.1 MAG: AAA-4 family protein [Parcubacteria 